MESLPLNTWLFISATTFSPCFPSPRQYRLHAFVTYQLVNISGIWQLYRIFVNKYKCHGSEMPCIRKRSSFAYMPHVMSNNDDNGYDAVCSSHLSEILDNSGYPYVSNISTHCAPPSWFSSRRICLLWDSATNVSCSLLTVFRLLLQL